MEKDERDTIEKLQYLSAVKRVAKELVNHIGLESDVLAEYMVNTALKSESLNEFSAKLDEMKAEFEDVLKSTLYRIVKAMIPAKTPQKPLLEPQNGPANCKQFPGLAIPNTEPVKLAPKDNKNERPRYSSGRRSDRHRSQKHRNDRKGGSKRKLELNNVYSGTVTSIKEYGFFVRLEDITERREGLVHISMIKPNRVQNIHSEVKRNQKIFIKVISLSDKKIGLSMRHIDQRTGEDRSQKGENSPSRFKPDLEERIRRREVEEKQRVGGEGTSRPKRTRLTSPERWELEQLRKSGAISSLREEGFRDEEQRDKIELLDELQEVVSDAEETLDVEVNDEEPPFLRHQTEKSVKMSPIRVVKNPDGSLSRAALTQSSLAKERREFREQSMRSADDSTPVDITRSWEDPMTPHGEKFLAQQIKGQSKKDGDKPDWLRQGAGKNQSYGRVTTMSIRDQRESLPIFKLKEKLLKAIEENDILVVIGATGSGKTTQMTQYLVEAGYTPRDKRIGCTQPRRVAAMSVAKRVSEEYGCLLGTRVGYTIRFEDCTSSETKIKYMTDGMLLRETLLDGNLEGYSVIILDEAHERTIHTDVLFGLMKKCVKNRPDLKLIVTSATLDAGKFAEYFNECPIFTIPGRLFPTTIFYAKAPEPDYVDAAMMIVMQIHLTEPPGDILLFLTGKEEIDSVCERLFERMRQIGPSAPELIVLPVYSALPAEMQSRIFEPAPEGKRKCVVATNIAEASLTIDGIFYVVDPGFVKQKVYNAKLGLDSLTVTPISQASANQRAGRSGRTGPGQCYRLYTEEAFEHEMLPTSVPEIQRTNLGNIVLTLKAMGINDLLNFDFMDPPPPQTLVSAMESLYSLGALDDDGLLTELGGKMAEFPLEPMQSKTLIQSVDFGCSEEVLTIVAMLSTENIWYRPRDRQSKADSRRAQFFHPGGDHLTLLRLYEDWTRHNCSGAWCSQNFVQTRAMRSAYNVRQQLSGIMDRHGLDLLSCRNDYSKVRRAITSGFFRHVAKKDPQEGYKTLLEGQQVFIHPSSALFNRQPSWVIYHHLVLTSREYMREVISVEPGWLVEMAPRSFKKTDSSKLSRQKRREKIEPLYRPNVEPDAWRLSQRGY